MTSNNNKFQENLPKKKQGFVFPDIYPLIKKITKIFGKCKEVIIAHKKVSLIVGIIVAFLLLGAIVVITFSSDDNKFTSSSSPKAASSRHGEVRDVLNQRLQDISDQLTTIRSHLSSNGTVSLDSINQQLLASENDLKQLSTDSNKIITDEIASSTSQLQQELVRVNAQIKKLEDLEHHARFLNPSDLPFQVIAIDNIQQNEVVTINYNHASFPIEIGSYVASWKLIAADFVSQKAEFINAKKQHVVVDLNRIDEAKH